MSNILIKKKPINVIHPKKKKLRTHKKRTQTILKVKP